MRPITFTRTPFRAIAYLVVVTLVGGLMGLWIDKAHGAAPSPDPARAKQVSCATQDAGACRTPNKKAKRFNRKFHNGDLGRANGFDPGRLFAKPKKARRIIIRRIDAMLKASRAAGRVQAGGGGLQARGVWAAMVSDTGCSQDFSAREFSVMGSGLMPCDHMDYTDFVGTETVLQGVEVTACAGGVAITLLTPVGRAAGSALKFWGASFQMTSCVAMAMRMGMD